MTAGGSGHLFLSNLTTSSWIPPTDRLIAQGTPCHTTHTRPVHHQPGSVSSGEPRALSPSNQGKPPFQSIGRVFLFGPTGKNQPSQALGVGVSKGAWPRLCRHKFGSTATSGIRTVNGCTQHESDARDEERDLDLEPLEIIRSFWKSNITPCMTYKPTLT